MKRATVLILILSLSALPLFAQGEQVSKARCVSLEHVRGAWVMKVHCAEGGGTITALDEGKYKGAGVFATWSQDELRSTYQALVPSDDTRIEVQQLG